MVRLFAHFCGNRSRSRDMEQEGKNQRAFGAPDADFFLQWGNRKRLRFFKIKDEILVKSDGVVRKRATSRVDRRVVTAEKEASLLHTICLDRNIDAATLRSNSIENQKWQSSSPEKEDRYYLTRGSGFDDIGGAFTEGGEERGFVWPKFFISLSSKEKEEDFMAMKGCKLPQRPKKRAKYIQRSIHLVSPGAWLSDLSHERYEVREKKSSKKRARGLKAMGGMESDSELERKTEEFGL